MVVMTPAIGLGDSQAPKILKVDSTAFPTIRVYFHTQDASWRSATAKVKMNEQVGEDLQAALDWQAEPDVTTPDWKGEVNVVAVPMSSTDAQVVLYREQTDPVEGLRVAFMVDASKSMFTSGRQKMRIVHEFANAVVAKLRPVDQVGLYRFASTVEPIISFNDQRQKAVDAISNIQPMVGHTFIFESAAELVRKWVREESVPVLPGRRLLFIVSDGEDKGSATKVEDVMPDGLKPGQKPTIFTIGVTNKRTIGQVKAQKLFGDLKNLAIMSQGVEHHLVMPTVEKTQRAVGQAIGPLNDQVLVEFQMPDWYWRTGNHDAVVDLTQTNGTKVSLVLENEFTIALERLGPEHVSKGKAYLSQLTRLQKMHQKAQKSQAKFVEETDRKKKLKQYLLIGSAALIVLVLVIITVYRNRRLKLMEREEDAEALAGVQRGLEAKLEAQEQRLIEEAGRQAKSVADAERRPLAVLVATNGALKGQSYGLMRAECTVGRNAERCDVLMPSKGGDLAISRVQASFKLRDGVWRITCLADTGMTVAGRRVENNETYPVRYGDKLVMGDTTFIFEAP